MATSIREGLARDHRATLCIHELFAEQARQTPEATAVICEDRSLTYRELNTRANQLAHYLRGMGVGPEVLVGLCLERSVDVVVGLLGILKAGGVYVPLDPDYPRERLAFLLQDTQTSVLITQTQLLEKLPLGQHKLICMDDDWPTIAQQSELDPASEAEGQHLAYVLYTSGSTGRPKGVLIEHHALATHCLAVVQVHELSAADVVLEFSTFSFDGSLEQMLPALLVGAQVVIRGKEMWTSTELLRQIKKHRLTSVSVPVAYWYQAISEWAVDPQQLEDHSLRLLIAGGDRFPPEVVELWRQTPLRTARFLNVYGPTETTITATIFDIPVEKDGERPEENISIGHPFPHHTIYLLDEAGQPVPPGVAGELYIGGELLARGYLNRPDLTTERFVPDPFSESESPRARLYKTGDLARLLPSGNIEFLGRIDQQVKIRGFRIELGEIEAALGQHPALRQVVVAAREDRPGDKRLVAYFVPAQEEQATAAELKNYMLQRLPSYMVPSAFVPLEKLPLSLNGKVDRGVLPPPEPERDPFRENYVAPVLSLHHQLVQIWEDLLGVHPIGIQDDFFELGGHSLLAVRLFDRIEQVCGKKLPLSTMFAGATIEQLATALAGDIQPSSDDLPEFIAIQTNGSQRPFFYLHGQTEEESAFHCYPLARALGKDQPFYGLYPYMLQNDLRRGEVPTMERAAAAHIRTIRSIQPEGPYLLGGFCNGGLMAYIIAQQLRAQGQEVDLLVLLDPDFLLFPLYLRLYYTAFQFVGKLFHLNKAGEVYRALRLKNIARQLFFTLLRKTDPDPISSMDLAQDYSRVYDWVSLGYRPSTPYAGKITFFWAQEGKDVQDLRKGWRQVEAKGNVEIHMVPGGHITCRTEYTADLATHLGECIRNATKKG